MVLLLLLLLLVFFGSFGLKRFDDRRVQKEFEMAPKEKEYIEEEIQRMNLVKEDLKMKKESLERMKEIIDE